MLNSDHTYYLQQMGIDVWKIRQITSPSETVSLEELAKCVSTCTRCTLHQSRTQTVFSRGNRNATLMVIGEAPGFYEDQQGKPFVGRAGSLLNRMLASIDLSEDEVYITNVLKCRPPDNRDPQRVEIEQCGEYLAQQIQAVRPKIIFALGRFAGQYLLKQPTLTLSNMRGKIHYYAETPIIVSYHPAYLLRYPTDKKKAYQDLLTVRKMLRDQPYSTQHDYPKEHLHL